MSVPMKSRWGAGGHKNAAVRRKETLPPYRRATPPPPAAPRNGRCRPWQPQGTLTGGMQGGSSPPCPLGRAFRRAGATAAGAHHSSLRDKLERANFKYFRFGRLKFTPCSWILPATTGFNLGQLNLLLNLQSNAHTLPG